MKRFKTDTRTNDETLSASVAARLANTAADELARETDELEEDRRMRDALAPLARLEPPPTVRLKSRARVERALARAERRHQGGLLGWWHQTVEVRKPLVAATLAALIAVAALAAWLWLRPAPELGVARGTISAPEGLDTQIDVA